MAQVISSDARRQLADGFRPVQQRLKQDAPVLVGDGGEGSVAFMAEIKRQNAPGQPLAA